MKLMKKILIIHHTLVMGGIEKALVRFLNQLPPTEEFEIDLLLMDNDGALFHELPVGVHVLPPLKAFGYYSEDLLSWLESHGQQEAALLRKKVKHESAKMLRDGVDMGDVYVWGWQQMRHLIPSYNGYDIAIAFSDLIALKILIHSVQAKRKMVWVHVDYAQHEISLQSQLPFFERADDIIFVTEQNRRFFDEQMPQWKSKYHVVHNILPVEEIEKQSQEYVPQEFQTDRLKLFSCCQLSVRKGMDLILDAAQIMRCRGIDFLWLIAGDNPDADYSLEIHARGLEEQVQLIGRVQSPFCYMCNCDLFVHAARLEGRPIVLEEAKAVGCCIISTNFSSVSDSLTHGVDGYIVDVNAEHIANAIMKLAANSDVRVQYAENAREAMKAGAGRQIDAYLQLLSQ